MTVNRCSGSPLNSSGDCGARINTEETMTIIPTRARPEARDSLCMSRYRESGKETHIVHNAITNCRLPKTDSTGVDLRCGKTERMTWGMVSPLQNVRCRIGYGFLEVLPMIMPNAHIPGKLR